jgi:deoxyxylulose-5-phosphate synthase
VAHVGPADGHDTARLERAFGQAATHGRPGVVTVKGKEYESAEQDVVELAFPARGSAYAAPPPSKNCSAKQSTTTPRKNSGRSRNTSPGSSFPAHRLSCEDIAATAG